MERKQAGMAVWVIVFVVFAAMASTWWAVSQTSRPADAVVARAAPAAASPDAVRVNGSQPLVPPKIRVLGKIRGLALDSRADSVEVFVGGRPMPVSLEGFDYTAQIDGFDPDAMVVVEVRSLRVHYRSLLGSVRRLTALAGSDRFLDVSEHSALHVSPFSTALAWMATVANGGISPPSDAAFEQVTRTVVGPDLGVAAHALRLIAEGQRMLPAGYQDGTQLLADRVAYSDWLQLQQLQTEGGILAGYLDLENRNGVSLIRSLDELPERLVLTTALAADATVPRADEITVIERNADGSYGIYENEPGPLAGFQPQLAIGGQILRFNPLPDAPLRNLDLRNRLYERKSRGHWLTRLTRGENFDIWLVRSYWEEKDLDSSAPANEVVEYRVLSGFSLSAEQRADAWPAMLTASRALPWMCLQNVSRPDLLLSECDYVQHTMRGDGSGTTFDHGWKVDGNGAPRVATGAESFTWSLEAEGELKIVQPQSETRYWRLNGGTPHVGGVVYLSRHMSSNGSQVVAGLNAMVTRAFSTYPTTNAVGTWSSSIATAPVFSWPTEVPAMSSARSADGHGLVRSVPAGTPRPMRWQVLDNSVLDVERRATFADGQSQFVDDCPAAMAAGARTCQITTRYFKPIQLMPDRVRYHGIVESYWQLYANTLPVPPGQASIIQRLEARGGEMICVEGACRPSAQATATAVSIPPLAAPGRLEFASRSPRITASQRIPRLMPIYAFECTQCGHSFDRLQKLSDPDPDTCPACSAHAVKRQLTAPSFRLAGSGWYETDFKKDGDKKRNLADGGEGAKPSGESKPAESAPAKTESAPAKTESKPASPSSTSSS
jgi:putative FmdB family regulatory protein